MRRILSLLVFSLSFFVASAQQTKFDYIFQEAMRQKLANKYDAAIDLFDYCHQLDPHSGAVLYELSELYPYVKNDSLAIHALEEACRLDPKNYWYKNRLVSLYLEHRRMDDALKNVEEMARLFPEKGEVLMMLLELYENKSDYAKMVEVLDKIEVKEGKSEQLSMEKFRLFLQMNDEKRAFEEMENLANEYPNDLRYQVVIGDLYLDAGKKEDALKQFKSVEAQDPNNVTLLLSMANFYHQEGDTERYQEYKVKYEGNSGIRMALAKAVRIVCPKIMVWMLRDLEWKDSLPFDVLDDRWDTLARELQKGKYHEVFREQLEHQKELTAEIFRAWLQKYEVLTGSSYLDTFRAFSYDEEDIFDACVRFGAVSLWDFFNEHKDEQDTRYQYSPLRYVWDMVAGVKTRPAFDFWQSFFSTFGMRQLRSFFQDKSFHEAFSSASRGIYGYSSHQKEVRYQRTFLTREENRRLYEWIDESVFQFAPSDYDDMVFAFLTAPETLELYDRAELRPIFDSIQERKPNHSDIPALKRVFLSADELEAERQAEEERKQRKKLAYAEAERIKTCKEMDERFDGTLESVMKYLDRCYYSSAKRYAVQHAVCLLAGILMKRRTFSKKEFGTLLEVLGTLVQYGEMKQADVLKTLNDVIMLEEEEAKHADDD